MEAGRADRFERQRAQDLAFLSAEADRQQRQRELRSSVFMEQDRELQQRRAMNKAFALQSAGRRLADRTPTGGGSRADIRMAGQQRADMPEFGVPDPFAAGTRQPSGFVAGPEGRLNVGETPPQRELYGRPLTDQEVESPMLTGVPLRVLPNGDIVTAEAPGGFVGAGTIPQTVTQSVAQQLRTLEAARGQIPQDRFNVLEGAVRTGKLTPNQLVNSIEDALPGKPARLPGRSVRDIETNLARLRSTLATRNDFNDETGEVRSQLNALIAQEENSLNERKMQEINPMYGQSLAGPAPNPNGKQLTTADIDGFLQQAGGDPQQAEQLARDAGFVW
jgi:hypothetical protein